MTIARISASTQAPSVIQGRRAHARAMRSVESVTSAGKVTELAQQLAGLVLDVAELLRAEVGAVPADGGGVRTPESRLRATTRAHPGTKPARLRLPARPPRGSS